MPYTLRFSDASKLETVIVPDMPPGINTIDTSLSLPGKGYPNYGLQIAQNFLSLLENFAGPLPPENPIEGQLWYDTSDPNNKVLRIMDGTADSTRWPVSNGIYQQGTDPKDTASAGLKVGDIWVDTASNQLKIYNSNNWTVVGPSTSTGASKTGPEADIIEDTLNVSHRVIKNYVDGSVLFVVANETFTPKVVIEGFTILKPGINLKTSTTLNGLASAASSLDLNGTKFTTDKFLRKDDASSTGQVVTGKVFFQTPLNQTASQGRDGILINTTVANTEYIQLYKYQNDAVLLNNTPGGKIIFKTKPSTSLGLVNGLTIENNSVSINTTTNSTYALDVFGSVRVSGELILSSTSSAVAAIAGSFSVDKDFTIKNNLWVQGLSTLTGVVSVGSTSSADTIIIPNRHDSYDLGSPSKYFRSLYVSSIGSTGTGTTLYGNVVGSASRLTNATEFKLEGQVTAPSFLYIGTSTTATFTAQLSESAITDQPVLLTTTNSLTLLTIDTSTSAVYTGLRKISKADFVKGLIPSGTIMPYGGTVAPEGWLLCDGQLYPISQYFDLFNTISGIYGSLGSNFYVPNMTTSTTAISAALGPVYVTYIIKI